MGAAQCSSLVGSSRPGAVAQSHTNAEPNTDAHAETNSYTNPHAQANTNTGS
jgi:hypothetical protein